jgi:hypothetical protein
MTASTYLSFSHGDRTPRLLGRHLARQQQHQYASARVTITPTTMPMTAPVWTTQLLWVVPLSRRVGPRVRACGTGAGVGGRARAGAAPSSKTPSTLPAPLLLVGGRYARGCGGLWRVGACCGRSGRKGGEMWRNALLRVPAPGPARASTRSPTPRCVLRVVGCATMQGGGLGTYHGTWGERWRVTEVGRLQKWWCFLLASYPFLWGACGAVSCPRTRARSTHPLHPQK